MASTQHNSGRCRHATAHVDVSCHARDCGFQRVTPEKRIAATSSSGRLLKSQSLNDVPSPSSFPGPLVVPGDDLAIDPDYPPHSFRSFTMFKSRNSMTSARKTIYVVDAPLYDSEVKLMGEWMRPVVPQNAQDASIPSHLALASAPSVRDYLAAFYHGFAVKTVSQSSHRWMPWEERALTTTSKYVGLAMPDGGCTRVRIRPSPDGVARRQLNLNDILDALIEFLPKDAYAIVLLVHQDLYEDEDDDFCCGRAYGSSRVSVVSTFRYRPVLDPFNDVDLEHMWPASHCRDYVDALCGGAKTKATKLLSVEHGDASAEPLAAAIQAASDVLVPQDIKSFVHLWFSRVVRTVAHELGHCLGMDHCVYYACSMQGTGSIAEDVRQPPYLCPVCLAKLKFAAAGEAVVAKDREAVEKAYVIERYKALRAYCGNFPKVGMFAGYHAWLDARLKELGAE